MILDWIQFVASALAVAASYALAQMNAAGHEPLARSISLSVGAMAVIILAMGLGRMFDLWPMQPLYIALLLAWAVYCALVCLRLHILHEARHD